MTEVKKTTAEEKPVQKEVEGKETEVKETKETKPETEQKAGEILKDAKETKETKSPETVPLSAFLEEKNGRKAAEDKVEAANKEIAELKTSIQGGATKAEITADVKAIADKYGVDVNFLTELAQAMKLEGKKGAEEVTATITKAEREKKVQEAFDKAFKGAMEKLDKGYEKIVNPNVIKTLSLDPANADKTFTEIIEEAYGGGLTGKRTVEGTKPGGGKEPATLDYDKARRDSDYFKEVMADPKLKAEYNAEMLKRGL